MSEVLGFTITVGIILTSVTLVFTSGFAAIEDVQRSTQNEDAEQAFSQIAAKFRALEASAAPYRAGELSVSPGQLAFSSGSEVNVTVVQPTTSVTRVFSTNALIYSLDETTLRFENNGVFRTDRESTVLQSAPSLTCTSDRAIVTVTTLNTTGPTSVSSDLVTVVGRHRNTSLWYPTARTGAGSADHATGVEVTVSTPTEAAWNRYLDDAPGWSAVPGTDGTYRCSADRVYVRHTVVDVKFI